MIKQLLTAEAYSSLSQGITVYREWTDFTNGVSFAGCWVYRIKGKYIDHDIYRNDLCERNKLELLTAKNYSI